MKIQDMKLDLNAICEFEKITGKTFNNFMKEKELSMYDLRAIIQAGLKLKESEEAGNLLQAFLNDETEKESLSEIIERKIAETMPTKKKQETKKTSKKK